ncbi:endonuclease III [Notoacmeibacter sp. MSK16QG-6]|uniref:endonuclease III domain-containing protein n=1 Tax=Notoacmeibacter sp. MSK16QG-6 TaxID=2957982 RepID=UPI0020A0665C|nr:endonuclease III [Notoacmeibacter sp. MSK16QG-6]MCP1198884.1 endonuclease III [Notoacmeibacter sp. MSK16QG-6]
MADKIAIDEQHGQLLDPNEVKTVFRLLSENLPGRTQTAKGPKGQRTPFRSAIACLLSAQSRDANTARATEALFALADTPEAVLALEDDEIREAIRPAGLYNLKTRRIRAFCETLLEQFDGSVPRSRAELMRLPGIGRKCADIVMHFVFDEAVIAVDTHVERVCRRTGLAQGSNAEKVAENLAGRAPDWALDEGHFWLIQHGKRTCTSRAPKCATCPIESHCLARRTV